MSLSSGTQMGIHQGRGVFCTDSGGGSSAEFLGLHPLVWISDGGETARVCDADVRAERRHRVKQTLDVGNCRLSRDLLDDVQVRLANNPPIVDTALSLSREGAGTLPENLCGDVSCRRERRTHLAASFRIAGLPHRGVSIYTDMMIGGGLLRVYSDGARTVFTPRDNLAGLSRPLVCAWSPAPAFLPLGVKCAHFLSNRLLLRASKRRIVQCSAGWVRS